MNQYSVDSNLKVGEYLYETEIPGLLFFQHKRFDDDRGFYAELSRVPEIDVVNNEFFKIKQVNLALSNTNVIRGFHAEGWNKLVSVVTGEAYCVLVDTRPESPSFGNSQLFILGDSKNSLPGSLYIPAGIANSLFVVNGPVNYLYCVDQLYAERDPSNDVAISLFDPDLNITWPVERNKMTISDRDKNAVSLREKFPEKFNEK